MEAKQDNILIKLYKLSIKNVPFFKYSGSIFITIFVLSLAGYAKLDNLVVFRYTLYLLLLSLLGLVFSVFLNSKDKVIKIAFYILVYSIIFTIAICTLGFASYILIQRPIFYKRWFPDMQTYHQQINSKPPITVKKPDSTSKTENPRPYKKVIRKNVGVSGQSVELGSENIDTAYKYVPLSTSYISADYRGIVKFDYSNNNGKFSIGKGDLLFETMWSKASNTSIHAYTDAPSIKFLMLATDKSKINEINSTSSYDSSSRVRTPQTNEIVIWKNRNGYYAATKILNIKDRMRGDLKDELIFEYIINTNKYSDSF